MNPRKKDKQKRKRLKKREISHGTAETCNVSEKVESEIGSYLAVKGPCCRASSADQAHHREAVTTHQNNN